MKALPDNTPEYTPVEKHGDIWLKRDDLYCIAGVRGGKVRSCWHLAQNAKGLITASNRHSPQQIIVSYIAKRMKIPARIHLASGSKTEEMERATSAGAELFQHKMGYNSVICARAHTDTVQHPGWIEIPFGMQSLLAIEGNATQTKNLPKKKDMKRIIVPVGSGIALSGIILGINKYRRDLEDTSIIGVMVGADRHKLIDRFAPFGWRQHATLVHAGMDYSKPLTGITIGNGIELDPYYEAKAAPQVRPGDLFWIVGTR